MSLTSLLAFGTQFFILGYFAWPYYKVRHLVLLQFGKPCYVISMEACPFLKRNGERVDGGRRGQRGGEGGQTTIC